jgi:hypothetical protein
MMKIHESVAENRLRFSTRLNEMSEELLNLSKEVDKNRKQVCVPIHGLFWFSTLLTLE